MSGVLESKVRGEDNFVDMFFPEMTCLWVAMESTKQGDDMQTIDTFLLPISKLVTNANESGGIQAGGMSIGIANIAFTDNVV